MKTCRWQSISNILRPQILVVFLTNIIQTKYDVTIFHDATAKCTNYHTGIVELTWLVHNLMTFETTHFM